MQNNISIDNQDTSTEIEFKLDKDWFNADVDMADIPDDASPR